MPDIPKYPAFIVTSNLQQELSFNQTAGTGDPLVELEHQFHLVLMFSEYLKIRTELGMKSYLMKHHQYQVKIPFYLLLVKKEMIRLLRIRT